MTKHLFTFILLAFFPGCDSDDDGVQQPDGGRDSGVTGDGGGDGDTDGDTDGDADGGAADGGNDSGTGDTHCADLGLPVRPFEDGAESTELGGLAADFVIPTKEGDWRLSVEWTGCDTYLFITDNPRQTWSDELPLWSRDVDTLLARSPSNVHYFFIPTFSDPGDIETAIEELESLVGDALESLPEDDRESWEGRIHYVPEADFTLEGWLGMALQDPGWGIGIDRFQRIRFIGSYADYMRPNTSWFDSNLSMAANEPRYYNFEAARDEALDPEATVLTLFDDEVISDPGWAGERSYTEVTLPNDPEQFDTLELDLSLACEGAGEYGDCPAWDYLVYLYLCRDPGDDASCDIEVGRWITTYHREGRWVHDISALWPLMKEGGTRRFAFYSQQAYEVTLHLRLSSQDKEIAPAESTYLFGGGGFGLDYNDKYETTTFDLPADGVKAELATVITGHGGASPGNCAEFCDTSHHFTVNGEENILHFPEAGTSEDCMAKVDQGTVPNQYGTWWFGRSGWCPGMEVPLVLTDITEQVVFGQSNDFEYEGFYQLAPYPGDGARIELHSWVVVSK